MSEFLKFDQLQNGNYVRIIGKKKGKACFLAVEIVVEDNVGDALIESLVQKVDLAKPELTIMDLPINIGEHYQQVNQKDVMNTLEPGKMVKIKGTFKDSLFQLHQVKPIDTLLFNVEKLRGTISDIDMDASSFVVNGVNVVLNSKTVIKDETG